AVLRKWRKLHLSNVPKTVLSMTMVLPLLTPDMFQEALCIIQAEADLLSRGYPDTLQFTSYLRLTWSNMASRISTYGCPVRTNNIVESFHNIAVQKLGTRNINIWTFLDAESSSDIIVQAADIELFTDNLNETFQTDQDTENFSDTQKTAVTHAIVQTTQMTQNEEFQTINITSDSETELTIVQTTQMTQNEESDNQTINITFDSETELTNMQDVASIYEAPEDNYGYLYSSTNTNESNASIEDLPFHTVD
ncbi:hypothetical protein RF55_11803, partial [Lasius niger]